MATVDRIDPSYTAWTPSAAGIATDDETYVGRHRRPESGRAFSVRRLFLYAARHRSR